MLLDTFEADFEWYTRDQEGYLAEMNRRDAIVATALKNFMGPEFRSAPLRDLEEVETEIEKRVLRLNKLRELRAPALILDTEQRLLEEILTVFQKGKYIVTYSEREYSRRYWERHEEFFSQDHTWDWTK